MKTLNKMVCLAVLIGIFSSVMSVNAQATFKEFKGEVVDNDSGSALELVNLNIKGTNISTVSNSEGDFIIKVPEELKEGTLVVSFLGYATRELSLSSLKAEANTIRLQALVMQLSEVSISAYSSAERLVRDAFDKKFKNNHNQSVSMTAFYRETIKKRRRNVSLTEAVVNVHKQPYSSGYRDVMELTKARKTTDYRRLDTISVKLKGGPFSNVYVDIMKYPEYIFADESIENYKYSFGESTSIKGRPVYVVEFSPILGLQDLAYFGKLYIDVQSLALVSADYALDVSDKKRVQNLLVEKKPRGFVVYPLKAQYHVDYVENNGTWYYSYSSVELSFKINKKKQLFNSVYTLSSEMAITDWEVTEKKSIIASENRLRPSVVIADEISGFSDPDFWGAFNLIEPDKSIESAIKKIRKKLDRQQEKGTSEP